MERIALRPPKKKKTNTADDKKISDITPELLAYSLPGALAHYGSGGRWQYASHLKLIEDACLDVASQKRNRILISLPPRHGKPVSSSSLVLMGDGTRKTLGSVKVGDVVITHKKRPRKVLEVFDQGELDCIRIQTNDTSDYKTTHVLYAESTHPILTATGWKEAGQIKNGDGIGFVLKDDYNNTKPIQINIVQSLDANIKKECRCLTVEEDHTFIANSFVVHNSTLISHYFPVWFLGHNPDKRVLFVSYQAEYAKTWGRRARNTFNDLGQQVFGLKISDDMQAANNWGIAGHAGGMETVGAEGALTGKGADLLLIDDPTKGREQALNSRLQANQYDWFQSDVYTRLEPGASILIVATRWSNEDLIGRLIDDMHNGGEFWDVISLPAIAEENDILGRVEGEALWPERYSISNLQRIRRSINEYWFNAEYQQRPAPVAGDLIKIDWFRRYGTPPTKDSCESIVISLDTASKEKEINDYSVITVWGIYQNSYYLLDCIRDRLTHPRLLTLTKNIIAKWQPNAILIEDKGSGISLIQHLRAETASGIIAIEPTQDKFIRMQNETPAIEAGQVFLPDAGTQPWLADFEEEIRSFPNSARKDQVDSFSQFLRWSREKGTGGIDVF